MSVSVAEYLGQDTLSTITINPVSPKSGALCPFMNRTCDKVAKSLHPVCSVRKPDSNGVLWITCEHRLCSSRRKDSNKPPKPIPLSVHQQSILLTIAKFVYDDPNITHSEIGVRREVNIPLPDSENSYHADYVMRNFSGRGKIDEILLEMQGGGETTSTGEISSHLSIWVNDPNRTNQMLSQMVKKASPLETNAWRRQQEQFLVKGNVVDQTGGKIVFVVGSLLFDYLYRRVRHSRLRDLRKHNWTLCLLPIKESSAHPLNNEVPLELDEERAIFTNYATFIRVLTDQGYPCPEMFEGEFTLLNNISKIV